MEVLVPKVYWLRYLCPGCTNWDIGTQGALIELSMPKVHWLRYWCPRCTDGDIGALVFVALEVYDQLDTIDSFILFYNEVFLQENL